MIQSQQNFPAKNRGFGRFSLAAAYQPIHPTSRFYRGKDTQNLSTRGEFLRRDNECLHAINNSAAWAAERRYQAG